MIFPQFRKYSNSQSYFKIISESEFIELKKTGKRIFEYRVKANAYPEKLYIKDMLNCKDNRWEKISEEEYLKFKQY